MFKHSSIFCSFPLSPSFSARSSDAVLVGDVANHTGPPLYDPERKILVHYDTISGTVVAHTYAAPGRPLEVLWKHAIRNTVQMMLYPDTGELILEDSPKVLSIHNRHKNGFAVVLDIQTGEVKGRSKINLLGFAENLLENTDWGSRGAPHQCSFGVAAACYLLVVLTAALLMTSYHRMLKAERHSGTRGPWECSCALGTSVTFTLLRSTGRLHGF